MRIACETVISFEDGTTLIKPSQNFLSGLVGNSRLILKNVILKNPKEGALFRNSSEVFFKEIKIEVKCDCKNEEKHVCTQKDFQCDQLQNIVCSEDHLTREPGLCKDLTKELVHDMGCQVSLNHTGPQESLKTWGGPVIIW